MVGKTCWNILCAEAVAGAAAGGQDVPIKPALASIIRSLLFFLLWSAQVTEANHLHF